MNTKDVLKLVKEERYTEAYQALMDGAIVSSIIKEEIRMIVEGYSFGNGIATKIYIDPNA